MIYVLRRVQLIRKPREYVFKFFEDPENLGRITPASLSFNMLTPRPISMHAGTVLDYTIRLFGCPVRWTTLIADYDPPNHFSDVAITSPYRFWHHTHTFVSRPEGTEMIDEVHYSLPGGPLGRLAHALWVKRQLKSIFDFRAAQVAQLFQAETPPVPGGHQRASGTQR